MRGRPGQGRTLLGTELCPPPPPPNPYAEALPPRVAVFADEAFKEINRAKRGHQSNRTGVLVRERQQDMHTEKATWGCREKAVHP